LPEKSNNIFLSARNIQKTRIATADSISSYDVLNANKIIVLESALDVLDNYLA
jgi:large subunit ribosomal protein L4